MKVLCPGCQTSIRVSGSGAVLECPACDLVAPISQLATCPGIGPLAELRDYAGERVGEYQIGQLIGVGGMGKVYRATKGGDSTPVAIKLLHGDLRQHREEFVERFERETTALYRLVHPNIVRILDHGKQDGVHYLVTELVEGSDLAARLKEGPLSLRDAIDIMGQVCDGMAYAHDAGVVHRDLKPANVIIAGEGTVKVVDFGLAQLAGVEATTLTRTGLAIGTLNYLAPEQRANAKRVDARADIFSLGVIFFEMLTGTLPIGSFALPSEVAEGATKRCDEVVKRALSPTPEARYQSVKDLADDLRAVAPRAGSSRKWAAAAVAVALAGAVGGGGWLAFGGPGSGMSGPDMSDASFATEMAGVAAEELGDERPPDGRPILPADIAAAKEPYGGVVDAGAPDARQRPDARSARRKLPPSKKKPYWNRKKELISGRRVKGRTRAVAGEDEGEDEFAGDSPEIEAEEDGEMPSEPSD